MLGRASTASAGGDSGGPRMESILFGGNRLSSGRSMGSAISRTSTRSSAAASLAVSARSDAGDEESSSTALTRAAERDAEVRTILGTALSRAYRRHLSIPAKRRRRRSQRQLLMESALSGRPLPGRPFYFTEGHMPDDARRDVNAEPTPYWVPPASEELCYKVVDSEWRREALELERNAPFFDHNTGRSRRTLDLLRRLHIPRDPGDPAATTPGILDIDPDYYNIVEGRPEQAGTLGRLGIQQYLTDIRKVLLTKLLIGFSEDHSLLIDEQYTQELKIITNILKQHQKHAKAFEMFLAEDHKKSMDVLQQADKMTTETLRMEMEVKTLNRTLDRLRNEVYLMEENWRNLRSFQRFLYTISPRAWRMKHDYEFRKHLGDSKSLDTVEDIVEPTILQMIPSDMSLDQLIALFNEEVDNEPPPELYFKTSKDLMDVFDNIDHINMDMMLHSEQVRKPLDELFDTLQDAQKRMQADTERMRLALNEQKHTIDWELNRAEGLEADARRLLQDVFKDLLINDEVIKTFVCVEDAFEVAVAINDNNLSVVEMMRDVERKYEFLTEQLNHVPPHVVGLVERDIAMDEKVSMLRARVAAQQMDQIRRLEHRMHKAMMDPPAPGRRMVVFRSPPFVRFVKRWKTETKLSKEERDMLLHLTEWCPEKDDPKPYLEELRETGMLE